MILFAVAFAMSIIAVVSTVTLVCVLRLKIKQVAQANRQEHIDVIINADMAKREMELLTMRADGLIAKMIRINELAGAKEEKKEMGYAG
jgi:hypothetical protein